MASVKVARLLIRAFSHRQPVKRGVDPPGGVAARQPVEGGEIGEVAADAQVEVQRRLLEHHPYPGERGARGGGEVMARYFDLSFGADQKAGQEGEERRLPRPVRPEQGAEAAFGDTEGHVVKRLFGAVGEGHAGKGEAD